MNALQAIREKLQGLNIPVELAPYDGEDKESYITYGIAESRGDNWGDNEAGDIVDNVEICIYSPLGENTEELTRQVWRLIGRDESFTFPRIHYDYSQERNQKCAILTCEYLE